MHYFNQINYQNQICWHDERQQSTYQTPPKSFYLNDLPKTFFILIVDIRLGDGSRNFVVIVHFVQLQEEETIKI